MLLASSSRDRLIHVFNAATYDLMQTLDDHSAAITSIKFCYTPLPDRQLCVISCGADKSLMFRTTAVAADSQQFSRTSYVAEKQTFYDLSVDTAKSVVYTIAQDRMVRAYGIKDGKSFSNHKKNNKSDIKFFFPLFLNFGSRKNFFGAINLIRLSELKLIYFFNLFN